jgi:hypothetical protein
MLSDRFGVIDEATLGATLPLSVYAWIAADEGHLPPQEGF